MYCVDPRICNERSRNHDYWIFNSVHTGRLCDAALLCLWLILHRGVPRSRHGRIVINHNLHVLHGPSVSVHSSQWPWYRLFSSDVSRVIWRSYQKNKSKREQSKNMTSMSATEALEPSQRDADNGYKLIILSCFLSVISTGVVAARFVAARKKKAKLWWDDWLCIPSLVRWFRPSQYFAYLFTRRF